MTTSPRSAAEDALVEAARRGDRRALEDLLERASPLILRFGMRMCGGRVEDAEDVLQDTLLNVVRHVGDFRGASSLSTWLYSIARSACSRKRRKSRFAPERLESLHDEEGRQASALPDPGSQPEQAAAEHELGDVLERAIAGLDPKYREVLLLRDVEGLTAPEVAEVLGLRLEAVKTRLHRARAQVRAAVRPWLGAGADEPPVEGCPDVVSLWSRYLEGDIRPETCSEMERHLESCPRCRGACDSLKRTLALCRALPAGDVPVEIRESLRRAIARALGEKGGETPP